MHQKHQYNIGTIQNINPFLSFDDEGNAMIFYGQDTLSMNGYSKTDGEDDLLMLKKFNDNGNLLLEEKNVVKTNAIIDYVVLKKGNYFYIIWLDPRNNTNFIANYIHTYYVDIYYKIIDDRGRIIKDDTRLTSNLQYFQDAQSNYILTGIYDGTINSLKNSDHFIIESGGWNPTTTWIVMDMNNFEYHITTYGNHMADSSKITYTKLNQDSIVIVGEKTIAVFTKMEGVEWGPDIQNLFFSYERSNRIHLCWQLNDGSNYFIYYYAMIKMDTNQIFLKSVGVKYPVTYNTRFPD
jgi:hypothetical protein